MHKTLLPISTPALIAVALLPSSPCSAQSKYAMAAGSILSGSVHDNFFEAASLRPAMTGLLVLEAVERTIWFHNSADICAPSPVQRQGTNPSTNGSTVAINDDSEQFISDSFVSHQKNVLDRVEDPRHRLQSQ